MKNCDTESKIKVYSQRVFLVCIGYDSPINVARILMENESFYFVQEDSNPNSVYVFNKNTMQSRNCYLEWTFEDACHRAKELFAKEIEINKERIETFQQIIEENKTKIYIFEKTNEEFRKEIDTINSQLTSLGIKRM